MSSLQQFKNLDSAPFEYINYALHYKKLRAYHNKIEKNPVKVKTKTLTNKYALGFTKKSNFYSWQNRYKNVHLTYKSIKLREILCNNIKKKTFDLNLFFFQKFHNNSNLSAKFYSFYSPKLTKVFKSLKKLSLKKFRKRKANFKAKQDFLKKSKFYYKNQNNFNKNKVFRKLFKAKTTSKLYLKQNALKTLCALSQNHKSFVTLAKTISSLSFSPKFSLKVWKTPLPKTYVLPNACLAFNRFKTNIHFWSGLQSIRCVVSGKGSSQLLANYVANGVRRNRKRVAFIMYLKRLIDWHFKGAENLQIQGIRIEAKGRFNAKSRCRKYILCVGRVAKSEKTSYVDYAFAQAVTVFGSLGIKVWICPN
jgi:hypothetical protein